MSDRLPGAGGGASLARVVIRLTAGILAILVLAHFAATHILTDVAETGSAFVAERWSSGLIAALDWVMLATATAHGIAGAWIVTGDLVAAGRRRDGIRTALVALGVAMVTAGSATLLVVLGR